MLLFFRILAPNAHVLQGGSVPSAAKTSFAAAWSPVGLRLQDFERRSTAALAELGGSQENTTALKKLLKSLTEIVEGILGEIDRLETLANAFDAGNFSRLVQWANSVSKDGTIYRAGVGMIIAEPDRADPIKVKFPAEYRVPSREPFKTFRVAITG